jgi:hypothetical protein
MALAESSRPAPLARSADLGMNYLVPHAAAAASAGNAMGLGKSKSAAKVDSLAYAAAHNRLPFESSPPMSD